MVNIISDFACTCNINIMYVRFINNGKLTEIAACSFNSSISQLLLTETHRKGNVSLGKPRRVSS